MRAILVLVMFASLVAANDELGHGRAHGLPPRQTPTFSQSVYVNSGGSDVLGDGSNTNPFATVGKAMSSIMDASATKKYSIEVGSGRYSEVSLDLKPWVFIIGRFYEDSYLSITGGSKQMGLDAGFANGGNRAGLLNLYLNAGTGLFWNLTSIGGEPTPSAVLAIQNCWIGGNVVLVGRYQGIDFLETEGTDIFGSVIFDSVSIQSQQLLVGSDYSLWTSYSGDSGTHIGTNVGGVMIIDSLTSGLPQSHTFSASSFSFGGLTLNGESVSVALDAISVPPPPIFSILNGAQVQLLTFANAIAYTPGNSTSWSNPPPTTIQDAIDRLAAARLP